MEKNRAKGLRVQAGFKQQEAAAHIGITHNTLSSKETGKTPFTFDEVEKLAELYGVDLNAFGKKQPH